MSNEMQPIGEMNLLSNGDLYTILTDIRDDGDYSRKDDFAKRSISALILAERGYAAAIETLASWLNCPEWGIGKYQFNYLTGGPTDPWEPQYASDAEVDDVVAMSALILGLARVEQLKDDIQKLGSEPNHKEDFYQAMNFAHNEMGKTEPATPEQWTELVLKFVK